MQTAVHEGSIETAAQCLTQLQIQRASALYLVLRLYRGKQEGW